MSNLSNYFISGTGKIHMIWPGLCHDTGTGHLLRQRWGNHMTTKPQAELRRKARKERGSKVGIGTIPFHTPELKPDFLHSNQLMTSVEDLNVPFGK